MRCVLFSLLLFSATEVMAGDSVRISYDSGYPTPGLSSETLQVSVTRDAGGELSVDTQRDIDRYFANIQRALDLAHAPAKWWPSQAIHAPTVTIDIVLGNRKHTLTTSYGVHGPEVPLDASKSDLRQLVALKEIIRLTADRIGTLLLGKSR